MFDRKSELDQAFNYFHKKYCKMGYLSEFVPYLALVESRISNDLLLISNQQLCIDLGVDIEMLYTELRELVDLRQKLSLVAETEKKNECSGRSK